MVTDKFSLKYNAEDLHKEWEQKIGNFRELLNDFPEYALIMDALIVLAEHIYNSEPGSWLFPGTDLDKLVIMPVKNQEIQTNLSLDIRSSEKGSLPFLVSLRKEWNSKVEWEIQCETKDLIDQVESGIKQLY